MKRVYALMFGLLVTTSFTATSSFAEWVCVHGSDGQFQNERELKPRTTWTDEYRFPWGFEFRIPPYQADGEAAKTYATIFYSIPVHFLADKNGNLYSNPYGKLRIHFTTENWAMIKAVAVRDGGWWEIQTQKVMWGLHPEWKEYTETLDFDEPHQFTSSVGITVETASGLDSYWHKGEYARLYIHGICLGN